MHGIMIIFFLFSTYKVWLRQLLISGYIILYYIIYIYKESYWLYIVISITLWLFNWYQTFFFMAKDKHNVYPIYMEWNKSFKYTHFIFWIRKLQTFQKQFFVLNTYHLLFLTTHKIFYLLQNILGKESIIESLYPASSIGSQG